MSRTVRRIGSLLAASTAALAASLGPATAAFADGGPTVSDLRVSDGAVDFTLAVPGLAAGAAPPAVAVSVDGVRLPATVGPVGSPAAGTLSAGTGQSGSPAPLASASPTGPPVRRGVVIVFDASGSMAGAPLAAARAAAVDYARLLPSDVELGLVGVADRARTLLPPTTDRAAFTAALGRLSATGGTALYDGVRRAVAVLDSAGLGTATQRRVLVLSDGQDTSSTASLPTTVQQLTGGRVPVDVVALGPAADRAALGRLCAAAAGRLLTADDSAALAGAFRAAATSFTLQLRVHARVPASLAGQSVRLRIDVVDPTSSRTVTVPVTFDGQPTAALLPYRVPALPALVQWAIVAVAFAALILLGYAAFQPAFARTGQRRVAQIERHVAGPQPVPQRPNAGALTQTALALSQRAVQARGHEDEAVVKLDRAGMSLRPNEWLLLCVSGWVAAIAALSLLLPFWAALPLGALAGGLGCLAYRKWRTRRRTHKFAEQFPDALQLVIGSLRSGFSLAQAVDGVVRETAEPLSAEFGRALAETRLGAELEDALTRVADRTNSTDLRWAVMAVRIQREVGGNLAEVLETAVETIRERGRLRRHVRALSAEGRLSAYVLIGLPIGLGLFMFTVRNSYVRPLYTTPLGILMLVVAAIMVGLGALWMSRLVKVEV